MNVLSGYGSSDEDDRGDNLQAPDLDVSNLRKKIRIEAAPVVHNNVYQQRVLPVDPHARALGYNPTYEALYGPEMGPSHPTRSAQQRATRNMLSGYVEEAGLSDFAFEQQRRTFQSFGYAVDPSGTGQSIVGDVDAAMMLQGATVWDATRKRPEDKRKRENRGEAGDLENYKGPWARYQDEQGIAMPSEEQQEILAKWKEDQDDAGKGRKNKKEVEEKSTLHIQETEDYQGRSFLDLPKTVPTGTRVDNDEPPDRCFIPDKCIHTWEAHAKGVSAVVLFPVSGHLVLTAGMDGKVKLWEYYGQRRLIRTYAGHAQAVRSVAFNNDGSRFLSASYDRHIKLWDTYSGACLAKFTTGKIPYCVAFNPAPDKQHMFIAGMNDKKIVQWDTNTGEIVQEYDRHLGPVNTVTFIDRGNRIVSTSDDKSIRLWEWEIPVDFKNIAEPDMHSMPAVSLSRNGKWMAMQSMDNAVYIYGVQGDKFRANHKKTFKGHLVAGYACQVNFSADGKYVISGDSEGKLVVWDWKTTKMYKRLRAHDNVCIGAVWHPHEPSQVVTCSWDGTVKIWD